MEKIFLHMTVLKGNFYDNSDIINFITNNETLARFFYFNNENDRNIFYSQDELLNKDTRDIQISNNINTYFEIKDKSLFYQNELFDEKTNTTTIDRYEKANVELTIFNWNPQEIINPQAYKPELGEGIVFKKDYFNFVLFFVENELKISGGQIINDYLDNIPYYGRVYSLDGFLLHNKVKVQEDIANYYLDKLEVSKN